MYLFIVIVFICAINDSQRYFLIICILETTMQYIFFLLSENWKTWVLQESVYRIPTAKTSKKIAVFFLKDE